MHIQKTAVILVVLAGCLLAGCALDRCVKVEPGEYAALCGIGAASQAATQEIQKVEIDRGKNMAVFTLVDGSRLGVSFVSRERASWPSGCPTNVSSTDMEVLDIQKDSLVIGSTAFSAPVLVRDCGSDPVHIALRQDGRIGGGGGACMGANQCILFGR
jgi:hypothetical protein